MTTLLANNHHTHPTMGEGIVERLFNDVFENFWQPGGSNWVSGDVYDNGKEYLIEEAVPGMSKKDLKLTVDENGRLILKGERKVSEQKKKSYYQYKSSIYKTYLLPEDADLDKIKAHVKDGLMRIHIAKSASAKGYTKTISIRGGDSEKSIEGRSLPVKNWWNNMKNWFKA